MLELKKAVQDLSDGAKLWRVWTTLGWHDIQQRYRRSALGPIWIILALAVTVVGIGLLFGNLMKLPVASFMPYLAGGMVFWTFIVFTVTDATVAFTAQDTLIRQLRLPYSLHIYRLVFRNFIVLAHNAVVLLCVLLWFQVVPHWHIIFLPLVLVLIAIIAVALTAFLAIACTRFRDLAQVVSASLQILYFGTPILWHKDSLTEHQWLVQANPLYHLMDIVRNPFIGQPIHTESLLFALALAVVMALCAFWMFVKTRRLIAFWV